jgi:hypothetical protein
MRMGFSSGRLYRTTSFGRFPPVTRNDPEIFFFIVCTPKFSAQHGTFGFGVPSGNGIGIISLLTVSQRYNYRSKQRQTVVKHQNIIRHLILILMFPVKCLFCFVFIFIKKICVLYEVCHLIIFRTKQYATGRNPCRRKHFIDSMILRSRHIDQVHFLLQISPMNLRQCVASIFL